MHIPCTSSGQAAVITPRQVTSGLGARRVKAVAAAKHHSVIATEAGEVFTWGSNRGKCFWIFTLPYLPARLQLSKHIMLLQMIYVLDVIRCIKIFMFPLRF